MKLLENHIEKLNQLCDTYHVDKMYLFGSALNSNFSDESDIDFLVKFKPFDLAEYFENYMHFKENLKKLLGRDIDLIEEQTLKNPILINSINKTKELIYG
ncbi:nucleotidyltransferase family protein [Gillisia limnaea]|uniref:DNA polymerase beta domain protein region n=1 Tax=Gillisia limnaea (strain DSM 15749 / LMG 21470 / R-8282) TaxID=865937 RepID=H2BXN0_GILLR|nr:nucleotidyltransferase domain-containing protein [Gillisia limnaea]EHQ03154.1 DNA polymerase beta domain protein region [Gillisia limnaea DSM 15749]